MKVILQKDVKNLGQVGDVVSVKKGYARYFLFPKKWAMAFTEKRQAEARHCQKIIESKKKKAIQQRQTLVEKLEGMSLTFVKQIDSKGRLFGSVSVFEISRKLEEQGYSVDKKYVKLPAALKEIGKHKVLLQWNSELKTYIEVVITSPDLDSEDSDKKGESKKSTTSNKK